MEFGFGITPPSWPSLGTHQHPKAIKKESLGSPLNPLRYGSLGDALTEWGHHSPVVVDYATPGYACAIGAGGHCHHAPYRYVLGDGEIPIALTVVPWYPHRFCERLNGHCGYG